MFFRKPQILDLADRSSPHYEKRKSDTGLEDPSFLNLLNGILDGPRFIIIANRKTLPDTHLAAWTSAPASHKDRQYPSRQAPLYCNGNDDCLVSRPQTPFSLIGDQHWGHLMLLISPPEAPIFR